MSHNLNFGLYRIGDAFVQSTLFRNRSCKPAGVICDFGPFACELEPSEYTIKQRYPTTRVLNVKAGHVYGYKGKMFVFVSNAAEEIEEIAVGVRSTLQRMPERIWENWGCSGHNVDRRRRFLPKLRSLEEDASRLGIDLTTSNPLDACRRMPAVTRSRGLFMVDKENAPTARPECLHVRTQSYSEPRPSLQLREKMLKGVRFRFNGGPVMTGSASSRNAHVRTYGNRVTNAQGLLGNLFEGGAEYSGFVSLEDLRKCIGPLMTGFLARSIPEKTKKRKSRFGVSSSEANVIVDQRVENVELNRLFVVYAPACKSFVFVSSIVVTFTDVLIDARDHPTIPYFCGFDKARDVPIESNLPCILSMDEDGILKDPEVKKMAENLFYRISAQTSPVDTPTDTEVALRNIPFFADRWRIVAMVAVMFAHETEVFGLDRTLYLWFDREFDRTLFESLMATVRGCLSDTSYVETCVELRLTQSLFFGTSHDSTFEGMLSCVDQLIRTRTFTYRSAVCGKTASVEPIHPPPGLFGGNDEWSSKVDVATTASSALLEEDSESSERKKDVWLFVNSEIDSSAMCTSEGVQLLHLSTRPMQPTIR